MQDILFQTENLEYMDMIQYYDMIIPKGVVTFIAGESGTGKSTLLKLFNGTLNPSCGKIFYMGKDLSEIDTIQQRKDISLVGQDIFLFDCSIQDNFNQFYEYRNQLPPAIEEMKKFMTLCSLSFPLDKDCTTMSGGEKQRLYMAIFLSFFPKVLMLDEPTSALDQNNSEVVIENIIQFCRENVITLIIVSHDQFLFQRFAENMIHIER